MELLLPWLLAALVLGLLWYFLMARAQGGGDRMAKFGNARTRTLSEKDKKVTFDDVAGADEEKEELQEIVDFLKDPQKFTSLGARIPKGVLLVGPPGTGKTLIAKAVAGEAGVHFLSISGSDFVELYVGVGASRVRDLFEQAKKTAPAIVFIDEIDAVGRQRGTGLGGGHDEREQTLNQLLVEMDGFAANEGVVVLAATNRADVLDPALLRPGRFDRQIYVGHPDIRGREEILKVHVRQKPLAEDVDLKKLAQGTAGFTGADLENLINEAALLAARKDQKFITMADLKEAEIKVIAGPEKKSRVIPQHERELTAWHEAGHAVVMHALPGQDPVSQITIVPRGMAGGMTISLPEEDRSYLSKRYMEDQIVALLGGRVVFHGVECHDWTIGINTINDFGAVAVGVVKDRFIAVYLFRTLAVQIYLMASLFRVNRSFLDLDNGKRLAVLTIENIIAETKTLCIGHSFYFDLNTGFCGLSKVFNVQDIPTGFLQVQIDVQSAGGSFAHIRRLSIGRLRPVLFGSNQAKQICNIIIGKLGFLFADASAVLGVHAEDADIVEGVYSVRIIDITGHDRAVDQFKQRGFGRLLCTNLAVDKVNSILQKCTAKQRTVKVRLSLLHFYQFRIHLP